MTIPVIKNIKYGYVQVKNGIASIDTSMTDKAFDTNKPQGVYRCFTFQYDGFGGYDYEDVQHLVSVEESSVWDKVNRTTLLGFNLATNEFIVNYNAWLSLKDTDLKTDGELPHPSQAGWHVMILSTTKDTNSKFELTQIDGSKAYLSLKPIYIMPLQDYGEKAIQPYVSSVENKLKSVINSPLVVKNDALWTKSIEDNSVILVNDCVKSLTSDNGTSILSNNNKEYGYVNRRNFKRYISTYKYGKKVLSFDSATSLNPINNYISTLYLKNKVSSTDIEFTYTNNLNDILASGESLTFYVSTKTKFFRYVYDKTSKINYSTAFYYGSNIFLYFSDLYTTPQTFSTYKDISDEGIACDLVSLDSRKPFVYSPDGRDIKISGTQGDGDISIDVKNSNFIKNLPDEFIAVTIVRDTEGYFYVLRIKNGEPVKQKLYQSASGNEAGVKIIGSNQFGNEVYIGDLSNDNPYDFLTLQKDDLINGIGFNNYSLSSPLPTIAPDFPITVTILKV